MEWSEIGLGLGEFPAQGFHFLRLDGRGEVQVPKLHPLALAWRGEGAAGAFQCPPDRVDPARGVAGNGSASCRTRGRGRSVVACISRSFPAPSARAAPPPPPPPPVEIRGQDDGLRAVAVAVPEFARPEPIGQTHAPLG